MNKGLLAVGAVALAGLSAAVGWYGVQFLTSSEGEAAGEPSASPSAPAQTVAVTFDVGEIEAEAGGLFTPPECGEEWSADPATAHGISPQVTVESDQTGASATVSFVTDADQATAFLAQQGQLIVTRDGVVVTPDWGNEFVPAYAVASPEGASPAGEPLDFTGASLCDVSAQMSAIWEGFDWATATEEEVAERQAAAAAFEDENADLPAGEYKVYAWTPVILGEPAAAARALIEEGFTDLAYLQYTAGYSPLAGAQELEPYCSESQTQGGTEMLCDVPQEVLTELLEREVPAHYVVEAAPAIAISEAATFTIE
ncbi:hypothetical protein [Demequina sp. NBRC 110053]|uniref:hypothetical protein n=1 Tax=Demequina sp. NBRC 110053 TaxID=1570342 RepID=UPI0009FCB58F|nr:hypothetical protein [Demequina sp. NBRC 110053]